MVGKTVSHYTIVEEVGRGGMGVVYRALDPTLEREVALKVLPSEVRDDPDRRRRFLQEARAAAAVSHPHLGAVYEAGEADGTLFLAMEFIRGEKLSDLLSRGPLPLARVVDLATQLAGGIAAAHARGIVHRDVKPANVLVDDRGHATLIDFGLAKPTGQPAPATDTTTAEMTECGVVLGTAVYMSPEQVQGAHAGLASDIWSFGIVLYEMLSGSSPFERPSWLATLRAVVDDPLPPLAADTPPALARLVADCCDKKPERRPSAASVVERLESIRGQAKEAGQREERAATPVPPTRRGQRAALVALALTALLAIVVAIGWYVLSRRPLLAFSVNDTVLVAPVANLTGDQTLNSSLSTALQISLEESPHVNVLSPDRVRDALRRMRKPDDQKLTEEVAREVCQREGVKGLIAGQVEQVGGRFQLGVRVVDPATGSAVRVFTERAATRDALLPAVDALSERVRRALGEALASVQSARVTLAEATTSSLEALQLFSEAEELRVRGRSVDAREPLRRAVALDPEFARAYASLASTYRSPGGEIFDTDAARRYFDEALKRLDRVGYREQLEIRALHEGALGSPEGALRYSRPLVERYPAVPSYRSQLARVYERLQRIGEAITEYEKAALLDPRSPAPLMGLMRCHAAQGDFARQVEYYERAFALAPELESDDVQNHQYGWALIRAGREGQAREVFAKQIARGGTKAARGHRSLGIAALFQGRFREADREFHDAARIHESAGLSYNAARDRYYAAEAWALLGEKDRAVRELTRATALLRQDQYAQTWLALRYAVVWARAGRPQEAAALAAQVRSKVDPNNRADSFDLLRADGEIDLARGAVERGLETLRRAHARWPWLLSDLSLAGALVRAEQWTEAIPLLQRLTGRGPETWEGHVAWAVAHLQLAEAYSRTGQATKAAEVLAGLREIWKDADADVTAVRRARLQ